MTFRATKILSLFAVFAVFTFTSCDVLDTSEDDVHELKLHVNASDSNVSSDDGNNTIEVSNVALSMNDFYFRIPEVRQKEGTEEDTVVFSEITFDNKFPKVFSINTAENGEEMGLGKLEPGIYRFIDVHVGPPSNGSGDSGLGNQYSLMVEGSYNGNAFTLRSSKDTVVSKFIQGGIIEMTDQTATLNVDFIVNTKSLFKRGGKLVNPTIDSVKSKLSTRVFNHFTIEEGTRTLRKYENMRSNE